MSENSVEIPFGDDTADTATLLLAAAEDLDLDPGVVGTVTGAFVVPKEVADKAGVAYGSGEPEEPPPAKKTATRKK